MLDALQKGDEVVTAGGMLGKHREARRPVRDRRNRDRTSRSPSSAPPIAQLLPKGTIKAL